MRIRAHVRFSSLPVVVFIDCLSQLPDVGCRESLVLSKASADPQGVIDAVIAAVLTGGWTVSV